MASQSGVTAEIYVDKIPVFDEVLDYVAQGIIPGGIERNSEHASERVSVADDVNEDLLQICYDPQTSGGLLIAIDEEKVDMLIAQLKDCGVDCATIIGRITSKSDGYIMLKNNADYYTFTPKKEATDMVLEDCCGGNGDSSCCSGEAAVTESTPSAAKERFSAFMKEINSGGAIPLRTKELMAIALSLVSKCEPCVKIHLDKARSMGITEDEINEATWMAIAFGGAPIMMFYETIKEEV
jgi:AhpD family alkylhydroperoxidase